MTMSSIESPPVPPFYSIRLAVASDIERIARISVIGFRDSEIFRYERPRHAEFPEDAVTSFSNIYRNQLLDPLTVVVVAQDEPNPTDTDGDPGCTGASDQRVVVVGVASWRFPETSPRQGQFVVPDVGDPRPAPNRDLCQHRLDLFNRITKETETQYFTGDNICDKLVVHPSYRRRGHATSMLRWGQRLCDQDGVDQGVIPSHMGEQVYLGLGYSVIGEMHVPDDGIAQGFTQRVVVYRARGEAAGEA
ncbi:putative acyl- N-acyltransferases [Rosellinia necatrix]|uniref:Putative acyl-N-acyltransferases n=1 Tax=Rosellinia necatrix TaxID=77044 RepID=A0A1S7UL44_ROSNE|nr:putative acyl- N-acyltransferases [Rosellinia necatrix]